VIGDKLARANPVHTPLVVYSKSFDGAFKAQIKTNKAAAAGLSAVTVELEVMQVVVDELRAKNAEAMLNIACNKIFNKHLAAACKLWDDHSKQAGVLGRGHLGEITDRLNRILKDLYSDIAKVPKDVMRKIGLDAQVSREYKLEQGIKIAVGTVGTGLAVAGAVLPGTMPFAIALAVKSGATLVKEIGTLASTMETKLAAFNAYVPVLQALFRDGQAKDGKMTGKEKAKELTLSTLNTLLGIEVIPTVRKARNDFKAIKGKLKASVEREVGKLGHKSFNLDALNTYLTQLFGKAHDLIQEVDRNETAVKTLRSLMKELDDPGLGVARAQNVIDAIVAAAATAGGLTDAALTNSVASISVAATNGFNEVGNQMKQYR
jgi:hypothetical protein